MFLNFQGLNFNQERIRFWMDPSLLQISFLHHTHHLSNHRSCGRLWIKGHLETKARRVPEGVAGWVEMFGKTPKNPGKTWGERGYTTWKVDGDRHSQCIGLSWPRLLIHLLGVEPSTFSTVWFLVFCTWSVKTDVSYCWCRKMYVLTCSCSSLSHCLCRFNTI